MLSLAATYSVTAVLLGIFEVLRRVAVSLARSEGWGRDEIHALQSQIVQLQGTVETLKIKTEGLPGLWKEERERADSAYARARAAKSDAKRIRDEIEESQHELSEGDDEGGSLQGMLPVRKGLAAEPPPIDRLAETRRALVMRQLGRR